MLTPRGDGGVLHPPAHALHEVVYHEGALEAGADLTDKASRGRGTSKLTLDD